MSTTNTSNSTSSSDGVSGKAQNYSNISFGQFAATLATGLVLFGVFITVFYLLRQKFAKIYAPTTYLVPERQRFLPPPPGWIAWMKPVFMTKRREFIDKCGLDAYFFVRYLVLLLKIFVPMACVVLPVLLPINAAGINEPGATGLDVLGWTNIGTNKTNRFIAHLIMALVVIIWSCFVCYGELKHYIQERQKWMTSPSHRIRASATTVLVTNIPQKWCNVDALDHLFDAFPGGIRNIWINRDYTELQDLKNKQLELARKLESAETALIRKCKQKDDERREKEEKKQRGKKKKTKEEKLQEEAEHDQRIAELADQDAGTSTGNPNQPHTVDEVLDEAIETSSQHSKSRKIPIPIVGHGLETIGRGLGRGFGALGRGVDGGLQHANDGGFAPDSKDFLHKGTDRTGTNPPRSATFLAPVASPGARPAARPSVQEDVEEPKDSKLRSPFRWIRTSSNFPSPQPYHEDDEYPLSQPTTASDDEEEQNKRKKKEHKESKKKPPLIDWEAYEAQVKKDNEEGVWAKYIKPEDRETMRLSKYPHSNWWWKIRPGWWPTFGKKVDVINYCRLQLLVLNEQVVEAEQDLERYPLMNSAFIQFNHQVAAHMACQSVTHHRPKNMGPRVLEIDPKDVVWDNMSMQWWDKLLRTIFVVAICVGMAILYAFPMAFVGSLSQINSVASTYSWLKWLSTIPGWLKSFLQGVLPPTLQAVFLALVPVIFRLLINFSGVVTGVQKERTVQIFYFIFLFVQVFLVVSISSGITTVITNIANSPLSIPTVLANNLPRSSDYFFSYLLLQTLSNTSQSLAQLMGLFKWFIWGRMMDATAREKFSRMRSVKNSSWGTTFPLYTNLGCIVIIFSVISPLILIFGLLMAGGFWVVWRYQAFYVMRWQTDSGGLFFPRAVYQLFTGLYTMELCLVGLFFLVRNQDGEAVCVPHAIVMIFAILLTIFYQFMLNDAFAPLFKFVPITMEDEAQERQEAFERAIAERQALDEGEDQDEDQERPEYGDSNGTTSPNSTEKNNDIELKPLAKDRRRTGIDKPMPNPRPTSQAWNNDHTSPNRRHRHHIDHSSSTPSDPSNPSNPGIISTPTTQFDPDPEVGAPTKSFLFQNYHDELEDLTPSERDILVRAAFEHSALRMTKPCIWIPRDGLGVSDGEIGMTGEAKRGIWITNEYTGLDWKGRVLYRRPPPDFNAAEEFMQL
ncbi:DUF221-domain-containing protein [Saccharata proteae CBS 121410]|uniref:DUF221-domain-containing protein n=1 Tax=Saccharata proteae CBS 121410 TaxID=1314787 RepID=A0A9P4HXS6_9PEZI|nr:DUF221-domain-containing protein [Saccharata proteae CBS 121410]